MCTTILCGFTRRTFTSRPFLSFWFWKWAKQDDIGAEKSLDRYCDLDMTLNSSYDVKFLRAVIKAFRARNVEGFRDEVYKLSSRMTMDKTKERLLENILAKIEGTKETGDIALGEDYNPL